VTLTSDLLLGNRPLSVPEAEAALAEAREAAAIQLAEAERLEAQRASEREAFVAALDGELAALEKLAKQTIAEAERRAKTELPTIGSRIAFRRWLRGEGPVRDLVTSEQLASQSDEISALLLSTNRAAQLLISKMLDPELAAGLSRYDDVVQRADRIETELWRRFVERARYCAGELPQ
jgi:hypothetical protein